MEKTREDEILTARWEVGPVEPVPSQPQRTAVFARVNGIEIVCRVATTEIARNIVESHNKNLQPDVWLSPSWSEAERNLSPLPLIRTFERSTSIRQIRYYAPSGHDDRPSLVVDYVRGGTYMYKGVQVSVWEYIRDLDDAPGVGGKVRAVVEGANGGMYETYRLDRQQQWQKVERRRS